MSTAPRVSIVIPVFNDADTVASALESCLNQTMSEIEIICVDDASTDGTAEVIERFEALDPRVRLIRQGRNLSAFQARRAGILAATGEYVLFLDGDDELLPEAAKRSYSAAQQQGADLVGFGVEVVNPDGAVLGGYQKRLSPKHPVLTDRKVLTGLFPIDQPAQGQLWRYLFRTDLLRESYGLLPEDLVLPRVNDLPLLYLTAALAARYVSIPDRLYHYRYGSGASGQTVDTLEKAEFYADAIRSIDSIGPAVRSIARRSSDPSWIVDNYESVRLSIIGYVCAYLLEHTTEDLEAEALDHVHTRASGTDIIIAAVKFYPGSLSSLKRLSQPVERDGKPVRSVVLTTRTLTTGGVSGVLLAQATFLVRAGYRVTIVARRYGSDPAAVPQGVSFVEMVGTGLAERLEEWASICRSHDVDMVVDHQILYSRDWPEYALTARALGVATVGWMHSFAGRPIYDRNGLHSLLTENAPLLETVVTLSPLDVAFWKLRGVAHAVHVPNPPSPMMLDAIGISEPKPKPDDRIELVWWGRLDERTKQVSHLIEVAEHLRKLAIDFRLTIIGPDTADWTAARVNAVARKRRLEDHVRAIGERHGRQLIEAIDNADAFVSTSIIEGYQLTIAEAQARALPVFMYELPWLTLVQGNEGVVAVPQGDASALARQIVAVHESPERYAALSQASIVAARQAVSYDFAKLYEQVVTRTLPAEFSPEPSLADARQLLDLMIFFAEQNPANEAATEGARKPARRRPRKPNTRVTPQGSSFGHRVWRAATPLGRTALQIFPGARPLAHRAKLRVLGIRR